jgi:hypothetical protein
MGEGCVRRAGDTTKDRWAVGWDGMSERLKAGRAYVRD